MADDKTDDPDWKRTPAVFVDYFDAAYLRDLDLVRIAFGEYAGKMRPMYVRAAIMIPIGDVKVLIKALGEWVAEYDRDQTPETVKEK